MKKVYVIREAVSTDDETLFWSNQDGWVDFDSATRFYDFEICLNLPMGGEWVDTESAVLQSFTNQF